MQSKDEAKLDTEAPATETPAAEAVVKKTKPTFVKLDSLTPNFIGKGFNILAKIVSGPKRLLNRTYLDGTKMQISMFTVGDKTGTMELHLKNEQITAVKLDDVLILRNVTVRITESRMYLKVDEWGRIEVAQPEQYQEEINTADNFSKVEWELVDGGPQ